MGRVSSEFWERETGDGKKAQLTTEVVVEHIEFHSSTTFRPPAAPQVAAPESQRERKAA
jgi:hypothetical protein